MARIVRLIIIGLLVWGAFRGFFRHQVQEDEKAKLRPARSASGEDMVTCARCGVNLPRSEAVPEGNAFRCYDNPRCQPK